VLERLILRALAKDPAMRPTMDEVATALTDLALSAIQIAPQKASA
jgi:hypothetical protein